MRLILINDCLLNDCDIDQIMTRTFRVPVLVAALAAACLVLMCAATGGLAAVAPQELPQPLDALLRQIRSADTGQLAVSEEDGRFLRVMVATTRSQHALEIGAASGYSGIWIGLGLRETGGRLTTIEFDHGRALQAAENIRKAGLSDIVRVVEGDAFKEIPKLAGQFDFVFLDAWKRDYKRFFDLVYPRLDRGGLFLAHNVVNKRSEMGDFLSSIDHNPNLLTAIVTPSGEGISVSYKKK